MKVAQLPTNEQERIKAINDYYILDFLPDNEFDDVVNIVKELWGSDSIYVSLIDSTRKWYKCSSTDMPAGLIKDLIFDNHIKNEDSIFIEDIRSSSHTPVNLQFAENKQVGSLLHLPLLCSAHIACGALTIIDQSVVDLSERKLNALRSLARQIADNLELRRKVNDLNQVQIEQKSAYADLEKFSFVASHDLRSPLNNIISLTHLLKEQFESEMSDEVREYVSFLNNAAMQLADLVTGILEYSRSSQILVDNRERINIPELVQEVANLVHTPENIEITFDKEEQFITASRIALKQILMNLCDNAIKHNDKPDGKIKIKFTEAKKYYIFEIADNGPGIPPEDQRRIFELFERVKRGNDHKDGIGVGLAIVKRLVEKSGGEIKVESEVGKGTTFIFTIQK